MIVRAGRCVRVEECDLQFVVSCDVTPAVSVVAAVAVPARLPSVGIPVTGATEAAVVLVAAGVLFRLFALPRRCRW